VIESISDVAVDEPVTSRADLQRGSHEVLRLQAHHLPDDIDNREWLASLVSRE